MGTLYVGGRQLSSGYINNEDLTLEKFLQSSFHEHEKIYDTGDLAKYGENGNILYRGGKDDQIKLRGFRIELSEIESVIRTHNQVKDVVVLLVEDEKN